MASGESCLRTDKTLYQLLESVVKDISALKEIVNSAEL